jgi:translocation and assembly module TamA
MMRHGALLTAVTLFCAPLWASAGAAAVPYEVRIEGVAEAELRDLLTRTSRLESLRGEPPASRAALGRRAEEDVARLTEALRSQGFYAATVNTTVEDGEPAIVHVTIVPGPVYVLADYDVVYTGHPAEGLPADMDSLGLHAGMWARAAPVDEAQRKLLRLLAEQGRPQAKVVDRRIVVDHGQATMDATLTVDPGPPVSFAGVTFQGLTDVQRDYVARFVTWKPGERYDIRKVDTLRERLTATGLFESVKIDPAGDVDADGSLPLTVTVAEGPRRSIGLGGSYATDEGFSLDASWTHRNLFGAGESLKVDGKLGEVVQSLSFEGRKPNILRLDQDLIVDASARHQDSDAFRESTISSFVGVERKLDRHWSLRTGPAVEFTDQNDNQGSRTFKLLSLPVSLKRDTTDNLLNPTEGTRLTLSLAPYKGLFGRDVTFVSSEVSGSAYQAVDTARHYVLAGRFRLGSIAGEDTADIPANKRFYAGGGGSIRGFALQQVGPLDGKKDPLGGRSAIEVGGEVRIRVMEDFGIVPFVEGGNVYDGSVPEAFSDALWAAGIGLRYYTAIGPLRLDIAFPLNPRDGTDDAYQFYVSLGQAF